MSEILKAMRKVVREEEVALTDTGFHFRGRKIFLETTDERVIEKFRAWMHLEISYG